MHQTKSIIWHSCFSDTFHNMVIFLPMQGEHHAALEDILEQRNFLQQFIERVIMIEIKKYINILHVDTYEALSWLIGYNMLWPSVCRESGSSRPQGRSWEITPLTCTVRRTTQTAANRWRPSPSRRSPSTQTCCSTWTQNSTRWPPSAAPKLNPRKHVREHTDACIDAFTPTHTHTHDTLVSEPTDKLLGKYLTKLLNN